MKKLALTVLSTAIIMAVAQTGFAAENTKAVYDNGNKTVKIGSNMGSMYGQAVTVVITKEESLPSLSTVGEDTIVDAVHTSTGGKTDDMIKIPSGFGSGKYYVYLVSSDDNAKTYFMHRNDSEIEGLLPLVNAVDSWEKMQNFLDTNYVNLAIDTDVYEPIKENVAKILFGIKTLNQSYSTADALIGGYSVAEAAARIKNNESVSSVLELYANDFGINYEKEYNALSDITKTYLDSLLLNADYTKIDANKLYNQNKTYAKVKTSASWNELKTAVTEESVTINADMTYFNKLVLKDKVYQDMYNSLSGIIQFENIKTLFEDRAKARYDEEQAVITPGGGAPGGGGGTPGKISSISVGNQADDEAISKVNAPMFSDISGHWGERDIESLAEKNIISGYTDGTFKPDNTVTRAEFVKMIVMALEISGSTDKSFTDVKSDDWSYSYIKAAVSNGIVNGYEDGSFLPNENITRQDAAVMLYRACTTNNKEFGMESKEFADKNEISDYARDAVALLGGAAIFGGNEDGKFEPMSMTTRAQTAAIISRVLAK